MFGLLVGNGGNALAFVEKIAGAVTVGGGEPAAAFENEGRIGDHAVTGFTAVGTGLSFGVVAGTEPFFKSLAAMRAGVFVDRHG